MMHFKKNHINLPTTLLLSRQIRYTISSLVLSGTPDLREEGVRWRDDPLSGIFSKELDVFQFIKLSISLKIISVDVFKLVLLLDWAISSWWAVGRSLRSARSNRSASADSSLKASSISLMAARNKDRRVFELKPGWFSSVFGAQSAKKWEK